jgi:hypothetical protein
MKKIFIILAVACLWMSSHSYAVPANFYTSARPMGMGGAFTAVADDINAVYYNPAGLAFKEKQGNLFSYAKIDQYTDMPSFSVDCDLRDSIPFRAVVGSSYLRYLRNYRDNGSTVADGRSRTDFVVSFPLKINDSLAISLGYKMLRTYEKNAIPVPVTVNRTGYAQTMDLGALYIHDDKTRFGLFIDGAAKTNMDIRDDLLEKNMAEQLPTTIIIGFSQRPQKDRFMYCADVSYCPTPETTGQNLRLSLGSEYDLTEWAKVRIGYRASNVDNEYGSPTFGIGFMLPQNILLDMAAALQKGNDAYLVSMTWKRF